MWDRHAAGSYGVFKLAVGAALSDLKPPVRLKRFDHITTIQVCCNTHIFLQAQMVRTHQCVRFQPFCLRDQSIPMSHL